MSVILVVTTQILQTKQKQNVATEKLINGNKLIVSSVKIEQKNGKKRLGKYLSRFSFTIFVLVNIKIDVKKSANGE